MGKAHVSAAWTVAIAICLAGCGSNQPVVIDVDDDNPVMAKAIEGAKASVDEFIAALESPDPNRIGFGIKTLITEGEVGEHIWIGSVRYTEGRFSGEINNVPADLRSVSLGDRVEVAKEDISDWMYVEDGKLIGGYTIRALIELTPPEELPEFPFIID